MKQVKEKLTELKNIYTGELVYTSNLAEKKVDGAITFIQVFKKEDPNRKYFVNESAFKKIV